MADTRISDLTAGTAAPGDEIPVNRSGTNFKITAGDILKQNSGTLTANAPALDLTQTWNASGVTFTGLKFNVPTDTSASGSLLMDLQVGGASKFSVTKAGAVTTGGAITAAGNISITGNTISKSTSTPLYIGVGSTVYLAFDTGPTTYVNVGDLVISDSNKYFSIGTSNEPRLHRDANHTFAQRNGNNGQTFRLYGRYTDATNDFERFFITASGTAGAAVQLGTQKGATAGTARALELQTDGTSRITISATGRVKIDGLVAGKGGQTSVATNTAFGENVLNSASLTGTENTGFGRSALQANTTGFENTAIGLQSLISNTTGARNTGSGVNTLYSNTSGGNNVAVGGGALFSNTTGSNNTAVGRSALGSFRSSGNTAIGELALVGGDVTAANNTGTNNIGIGYKAGEAITTGSTNIVIGYDLDVDSATGDNQINIGNVYFHDRLRLSNTSSPAVTFGGTTSSFPALKRSSATLICRLADDTANAAFEAASLKTDAPAGGTAATWKLGAVATVSPTSPNRTIEVDIGGTIYYLHAKTTND